MAEFARTPPVAYWVAAALLTLWGVAGCYACYLQFQLGAEAMGPATAYDRALFAALPVWYNWVYALAVGGGLLGGVALLARSKAAVPLFVISLVAAIVQFGYIFGATDLIAHKGAAATVPFPLVIVLIGAAAIRLAIHARARRWAS